MKSGLLITFYNSLENTKSQASGFQTCNLLQKVEMSFFQEYYILSSSKTPNTFLNVFKVFKSDRVICNFFKSPLTV